MPGEQLLLECGELFLHGTDLVREASNDAFGELRHIGGPSLGKLPGQSIGKYDRDRETEHVFGYLHSPCARLSNVLKFDAWVGKSAE